MRGEMSILRIPGSLSSTKRFMARGRGRLAIPDAYGRFKLFPQPSLENLYPETSGGGIPLWLRTGGWHLRPLCRLPGIAGPFILHMHIRAGSMDVHRKQVATSELALLLSGLLGFHIHGSNGRAGNCFDHLLYAVEYMEGQKLLNIRRYLNLGQDDGEEGYSMGGGAPVRGSEVARLRGHPGVLFRTLSKPSHLGAPSSLVR